MMILVSVLLSQQEVVSPQVFIPENLNIDYNISILELIDTLAKVIDFTENHIAKDKNHFLVHINQDDYDKQDANFDTELEIKNQIVLKNGTHSKRQGQLFAKLSASALFILKFLVKNIVLLFINFIN